MSPLVKRSLALATVAVVAAAVYTLWLLGALRQGFEFQTATLKLFLFPPIALGVLTVFAMTYWLAKRSDRHGRTHHPFARGLYIGLAVFGSAVFVGGAANVAWFAYVVPNRSPFDYGVTPAAVVLAAGIVPAVVFGLIEGWLIRTSARQD